MDALVAKMDHFLTKQAISKYETGKSIPSSEVLIRLADVLSVKTSYFMQESKVSVEFIAYRKHSRMPKVEANRLQVRITDHLENYCWLTGLFTPLKKPGRQTAMGMIKLRQAKSVEDAEGIAKELREAWNIGMDPIENMVETLEDHATAVLTLDADARFDGVSAWATVIGDDKQKVPVLVTNATIPGDRQRFNLAHELGHLTIKQNQTKEDEDIAHRFAAAFLVPDEAAYKELGRSRNRIEFDELLLLKHKYGLSMQAWLRRAKDLGIISPSWYKNTIVIFRKRRWHKHEPGAQVAPEQPLRYRQLVLRAMAEGIISRERAEELNPGVVSLNGKEHEMAKARKIAALSLDARYKLLEAAAERAAHEYETNKELTVFTELDGEVND
ncbi:MAG: ImmA/IrrE family metallo-endopeptidase [Gammaproteobacteria bacterium]|nr:ImmA/IrrE family metallo-endopeptidase [Gammaproteobacteria bacterium]